MRRYFLISVLLVAGGLVASGLLEIYFRVHENREQLALLQKEAATVAAIKIEKFIQDVETSMRSAAKGFDIGRQTLALTGWLVTTNIGKHRQRKSEEQWLEHRP